MSTHKVRWGILGAANIARKNWQAIHNSGNGVVSAVASRELAKSKQFISECQSVVPLPSVPKALGSYEELIASKEVDAVYIPLPTGLRKEWVLRAAAAGKHVVCEKPCASSLPDLLEMTEACKRHHVQFMDGVMFMHSTRLNKIREVLDRGEHVGQLRRIATSFSFCAPPAFLTDNIRMHSQLEPQGCVGDLGWYCIRFALWLMQWKMPLKVTGRALSQLGREDSPNSVPTEFSGELFFDGGISMAFYCSFLTEHQQWVHLSGTRGSLELSDFVLPYFGSLARFTTNRPAFRVDGCTFNMEPRIESHFVEEYSNNHTSSQETLLFRHFAAQVLSGKVNPDWPKEAVRTQQVMGACLESARAGSREVAIASAAL